MGLSWTFRASGVSRAWSCVGARLGASPRMTLGRLICPPSLSSAHGPSSGGAGAKGPRHAQTSRVQFGDFWQPCSPVKWLLPPRLNMGSIEVFPPLPAPVPPRNPSTRRACRVFQTLRCVVSSSVNSSWAGVLRVTRRPRVCHVSAGPMSLQATDGQGFVLSVGPCLGCSVRGSDDREPGCLHRTVRQVYAAGAPTGRPCSARASG